LQAQEDENNILKEILASNGIPYEAELARRKAARQAENPGLSQAGSTSGTHSTGPQSSNPPFLTTPGTTVSSNTSPGASGVELADPKQVGGMYPQGGFHAAQNEQPGISEYSLPMNQVPGVTSIEMPGIFERDPQLGIEFILKYVLYVRFEVQCVLVTNYLFTGLRIRVGIILNSCVDPQGLTE
jgi:hypothetical protein